MTDAGSAMLGSPNIKTEMAAIHAHNFTCFNPSTIKYEKIKRPIASMTEL